MRRLFCGRPRVVVPDAVKPADHVQSHKPSQPSQPFQPNPAPPVVEKKHRLRFGIERRRKHRAHEMAEPVKMPKKGDDVGDVGNDNDQNDKNDRNDQPPSEQLQVLDPVDEAAKTASTRALLELFPELCPDFLGKLGHKFQYRHQDMVVFLLDQMDAGKRYPQRTSPQQQRLKRKRDSSRSRSSGTIEQSPFMQGAPLAAVYRGDQADSAVIVAGLLAADEAADEADAADDDDDDDDDNGYDDNGDDSYFAVTAATAAAAAREARAVAAFSSAARIAHCQATGYLRQASQLLRQAYPKMPARYGNALLQRHRNCLLPALLALETSVAGAGGGDEQPQQPPPLPYTEKKRKTAVVGDYAAGPALTRTIRGLVPCLLRDVLYEYAYALRLRDERRRCQTAAAQHARDEAANLAQAQRDGTMRECACCYADVPANRMVHCDGGGKVEGEEEGDEQHYFCRDCARRMAETQVGQMKYRLTCMSMDRCGGGFSRAERRRFLSRPTARALARLEQDHVLREAGIEGLARCPHCPFAAEYPPVEDNREFVCLNPSCGVVTCRLCSQATHVPQTCAEAARARGDGPRARLAVEEAMSMAMIRRCNRCATPFIKEHGCNKMTCTNTGCGNVQCYVCHKSCDYRHFDDATRGGKAGNCPLFESADERHDAEVRAAEAAALEEAVRQNPGLDPATLQFDLAEVVQSDERRRLGR